MPAQVAADVRLARVAVDQYGVFTRSQAIAAGFGAARIERRVRAGAWVRVLPRVYRSATTPVSAVLRHWAAVLWAGPDCVLSHASAAAIWRIPGPPVDRPELLVSRTRAPRADGVTVRRVARIDSVDVVDVGRLPVTAPARTIIDLAGVLDTRDLTGAVENARARGLVTFRALATRLDEIGSAGRPGAARLRALLAGIGPGAVDPSARMAG